MCASGARTGPCGGQRVIAVPTATGLAGYRHQAWRDVALKILPASFASDPGRMALRARGKSARIAESSAYRADLRNRRSALVMELIEGVRLKGPLSVEKAIEYTGQILEPWMLQSIPPEAQCS